MTSIVMPALTSPTTRCRPSSYTGVTTRTEGPSVPVYVSENVCPFKAGPMCPR